MRISTPQLSRPFSFVLNQIIIVIKTALILLAGLYVDHQLFMMLKYSVTSFGSRLWSFGLEAMSTFGPHSFTNGEKAKHQK